jgi:hypothetical protein
MELYLSILNEMGKSYPMQCEYKNLNVNDIVDVEMHPGTVRAYWATGTITAFTYQD